MPEYQYFETDLDQHIGLIYFSNPPLNHFSVAVLQELLDILTSFDQQTDCRVTVLSAQGSVFCAGGDFGKAKADIHLYTDMAAQLYAVGMQLFHIKKPLIAVVQGAAVGGGLGLALVADFRIAGPNAKFSANFTRLGFHPGFGTSVTLPRLVGQQAAQMMFYTGRRVDAREALKLGLVDSLVPAEDLQQSALQLALEIAGSAPRAVQDTRATLRNGLAEAVKIANDCELELQRQHMQMEDFVEGATATAERRAPIFKGK